MRHSRLFADLLKPIYIVENAENILKMIYEKNLDI